MKEYYYFDYLHKKVKYADLLQHELDKRIYYFGDHFKKSFEKTNSIKIEIKNSGIAQLALFVYIKIFFKPILKGKNIISTTYFGFANKFPSSTYHIYSVPWIISRQGSMLTLKEFVKIRKFNKSLVKSDLNTLISYSFEQKIEVILQLLENIISRNNIKGIFIPHDVGFFERSTIQVAKKLSIPTFLVLHGFALRYGNTINDNKTDYLCVFGDLMKQKLVESGFDSKKILVLGHPKYSNYSFPIDLRFSFEDIIVCSKPLPGQPVERDNRLNGRAKDTNRLKDRGNALLYLLMVKNVLQTFGVDKVRLRVHPSENPDWYKSNIDSTFFKIDTLPMEESLKKASLVIGPSSSLLLDSLFLGVNYAIFEPLYDDNLDILNDPVGYPFDGSEKKVPVANDEPSLIEILKNKKRIDATIITSLVSPTLNMNLITNILECKHPEKSVSFE